MLKLYLVVLKVKIIIQRLNLLIASTLVIGTVKKLSTDIDPVFDNSMFADLKDEFTSYAGEYYSPFKFKKF